MRYVILACISTNDAKANLKKNHMASTILCSHPRRNPALTATLASQSNDVDFLEDSLSNISFNEPEVVVF